MQCWWWYHFQFHQSTVEIKRKICAHIVPFNPFFLSLVLFPSLARDACLCGFNLKQKKPHLGWSKNRSRIVPKCKCTTLCVLRCTMCLYWFYDIYSPFFFSFFYYITYSGTIIYYIKNVYQRSAHSSQSAFRVFGTSLKIFLYFVFFYISGAI